MSKTKTETESDPVDHDLCSGFVPLYILHLADDAPVFGLRIVETLARHGYRISPGTLYPLLHNLEKKGYLRSKLERNGRALRRLYRTTKSGRRAFAAARRKGRELLDAK
jgi:PadR family transcriptional regulator PadR